MTNHHVFGDASDARHSIAEFNYELDIRGNERASVPFGLAPETLFFSNRDLDFTVVSVQPKSLDGSGDLNDWRWLPLSGERGKSGQRAAERTKSITATSRTPLVLPSEPGRLGRHSSTA